MTRDRLTKIVIVGGGFGGIRSALNLANKKGFEVTLISDQSYFEYHAALYRSATGRSPLEVAIPLEEFFSFAKNVNVVIDKVVGLDSTRKLAKGLSASSYKYDYLILALGNITQYHGIKGLEKHAHGVKTIHEALRLKRHIHEQLLDKKIESDYVVVGAGATGVELSAELASYLKNVRRKHKVDKQFSIDLIEAGPRIVGTLPEKFSNIITKRLKLLGVNLILETAIKSESADKLVLPKGNIKTHTVVWTAGVANNPFYSQFPNLFKLAANGKVEIDKYLKTDKHTFVIGDSANTKYSGMAQTAIHDANFVTNFLDRQRLGLSPTKYIPKKPIFAIPVGSRWAAVLWGRVIITGKSGWLLRRLADLRLYLSFLPNRKALVAWKYGFVDEEICPTCKK